LSPGKRIALFLSFKKRRANLAGYKAHLHATPIALLEFWANVWRCSNVTKKPKDC
jgi:hypothetical protein